MNISLIYASRIKFVFIFLEFMLELSSILMCKVEKISILASSFYFLTKPFDLVFASTNFIFLTFPTDKSVNI